MTIFRIISLVFGALFLTSAVLQYNDPDPWLWILFYVAAAIVSFAPIRRLTAVAAFMLEAVAVSWAVMIALNTRGFSFMQLFQSMKAETPAIEQSREILGLAIIALWMLILGIVSMRASSPYRKESASYIATPGQRD